MNSRDARPLGNVSGAQRPTQLPPCLPRRHLLKWKECLRGEFPQFSVYTDSPPGEVSAGARLGRTPDSSLAPVLPSPLCATLCSNSGLPRASEGWVRGNGRGWGRQEGHRKRWGARGAGRYRRTSFPHKVTRVLLPAVLGPARAPCAPHGPHVSQVSQTRFRHLREDSATAHSPFLYLERQFTGLTQIFLIRLLCPGEAKEAPCVTHEASPRSFRNSFSIVSQRSSLPKGPQLLPPAPVRVLLWQYFPRGHRLCCLKNVTFSDRAQPVPHMPV